MLMHPTQTERYLSTEIHEHFSPQNLSADNRKNLELTNRMLEVVSRIYRPGMELLHERERGLTIQYKDDEFKSPVTNADIRMSNDLIEILKSIMDIPVVSEEHATGASKLKVNGQPWWLVDPIDGTKSYIQGYSGYAVCVALMQGLQPAIGVIMFPKMQTVYFASRGNGSFKLSLDTLKLLQLDSSTNQSKTPSIASFFNPRPSGQEQMEQFAALHGVDPQEIRKVSAALKYCQLAEGNFSYSGGWFPLKLWDIAAADIIVTESGGRFRDPDTGQKIVYDPRALTVPRSIAIAGKRPFEPFDSTQRAVGI